MVSSLLNEWLSASILLLNTIKLTTTLSFQPKKK